MNLQTVLVNLDQTIKGKELALKGYKDDAAYGAFGAATTARFLEINIDELKRIHADVLLVRG